MFKSDYHIHSLFSKDSNMKLETIIKKSKELGLNEIAITDHLDYDIKEEHFNSSMTDLKKYISTLKEVKEMYKNYLNIKIGIEFGAQPHLNRKLNSIVQDNNFDFIILSTHCLDGNLFSYKRNWENSLVEDVYQKYFINLLENVKKYQNYSVLGHLDFISRYGKEEINYNFYQDIIDEIFKNIIHFGKGLEINTSGFKYSEKRFYPTVNLVKRYFELGGEILTIGSDAHNYNEIFSNFNIVYDFLEECNKKYICSYTNLKPQFKKFK